MLKSATRVRREIDRFFLEPSLNQKAVFYARLFDLCSKFLNRNYFIFIPKDHYLYFRLISGKPY